MNEVKFTFDGNKTTAVFDNNLRMLETIRDIFLPRMIQLVKSGVTKKEFVYEGKLNDSE